MDVRRVVPEARKLAWRPVEHDPPADEDNAFHEALDGPELMRNVEDRHAEITVETVEQSCKCLLGLYVDPRRRLVQDEQLRLRCERLGDECALLLPAGETHEWPLGDAGESDARNRFVDELAVASRKTPQKSRARQAPGDHDLANSGRRVEPKLRSLSEIAEREAPGEPVSRYVGKERLADSGSLQAEDEAHERRLAPAVRPGDGDELAGLDTQIDILQDRRTNRIGKGDPSKLEG